MARETWVQSQVESYQRLKKWYLMPPCLTLSIIRYGSRVKWSNPGKGVAPFPTPWCSKLSKREPSGHPRLWSPTLLTYIIFPSSDENCTLMWILKHPSSLSLSLSLSLYLSLSLSHTQTHTHTHTDTHIWYIYIYIYIYTHTHTHIYIYIYIYIYKRQRMREKKRE